MFRYLNNAPKFFVKLEHKDFNQYNHSFSMSSRASSFYLGLLSGLAIGAVSALLYAPDKGKNTRDKITYKFNNTVVELGDLLDKLRHEKDIISEAKQKGQLVVEEVQQRTSDLRKEVDSLLNRINKEVE
jgi:gas vesicle protein